jgi:hypothetical protein
MPLIAVAYHADSARDRSEHIIDYLQRQYGPGNVLRAIPARDAADLRAQVESTMARRRVLVVILTPDWATAAAWRAPDDPAHIMIATALRRGLLITPLLVNGARMPSPGELPPDLAPFADRQAVVIRDGPQLRPDLQRVVDEVNTLLPWRPASVGVLLGVAALLVSVAALLGVAGFGGVTPDRASQLTLTNGVLAVLLALTLAAYFGTLGSAGVIAFRRRSWLWFAALLVSLALYPLFYAQVTALVPLAQLALFCAFALWGPRKERLIR